MSRSAESAISDFFERGFLTEDSIRDQARTCEHYVIVERIRAMGRDNQPFLEAGCGAGKWVAWAAMNGRRAVWGH